MYPTWIAKLKKKEDNTSSREKDDRESRMNIEPI